MEDCIFCKIVKKEIPADIVLENEKVVAFRDLNPQAPVHVLVIPRKHVEGIHAITDDDDMQAVMMAASEIARIEGIDTGGYRVVINCGQRAGQSVWHLHAHVLGGRAFSWPPG